MIDIMAGTTKLNSILHNDTKIIYKIDTIYLLT